MDDFTYIAIDEYFNVFMISEPFVSEAHATGYEVLRVSVNTGNAYMYEQGDWVLKKETIQLEKDNEPLVERS